MFSSPGSIISEVNRLGTKSCHSVSVNSIVPCGAVNECEN